MYVLWRDISENRVCPFVTRFDLFDLEKRCNKIIVLYDISCSLDLPTVCGSGWLRKAFRNSSVLSSRSIVMMVNFWISGFYNHWGDGGGGD